MEINENNKNNGNNIGENLRNDGIGNAAGDKVKRIRRPRKIQPKGKTNNKLKNLEQNLEKSIENVEQKAANERNELPADAKEAEASK